MDHECAIIKNMNVHDTEWAYYAVPLMVLALSIHNEKERKIVMRKVMNRVLVVGIVLTVVYLFVEYYGERRLRAEKGGGMLIAERSITMRESLL